MQLANADADLLTRRRGAAPAAENFDIDPSLSRDEQIAALRRQLELLMGTPPAPPAPATPDASPDRPVAAPAGVADAGPGTTAAGPDTAAGTGQQPGRSWCARRTAWGCRARWGAGAHQPDHRARCASGRLRRRRAERRCAAVRQRVAQPRQTTPPSPDRARSPSTRAGVPLDDLTPSGEAVPNVDLGAALTDAIAARLAELPVVTVVSSDDGAAWIVSGHVQRIGGIVRVTARLIDAESGAVLKTVEVDGTIDALAELKERVASAMSESIRDALSAEDAADGHGTDADVAGAVGRQS